MLLFLQLIRAKQWVKNLFIFTPMIFVFHPLDISTIVASILAFIAFSLTASSVYIFNDINDVTVDRLHPRKKFRPIASGKVRVNYAYFIAGVLISIGLSIGFYLGTRNFIVLLFYVFMNLAYTLKLKRIAIIDIFCIATGFVLRLFMGGYATSIELSRWIIVMTFLLAIFIALGKRRDDMIIFQNGGKVRKSIEGYNIKLIDYSMVISASVTLVAYLMYTMSSTTIQKMGTSNLYITFFFVLLGLMRYLQLTFVLETSGSPTEIFFRDKFIQLSVLSWFLSFVLLVYCK